MSDGRDQPLLESEVEIRKMLPFMAFGRIHDQVILGCVGEKSEMTTNTFLKLLEASKYRLAPGKRLRLAWGVGSMPFFRRAN